MYKVLVLTLSFLSTLQLGKLKVFSPMSQGMKFCEGHGGTAPHILNCGCRLRPIDTHRYAVLYSLPAKWGGGGGGDKLERQKTQTFGGFRNGSSARRRPHYWLIYRVYVMIPNVI
jgi:hypothetical protein